MKAPLSRPLRRLHIFALEADFWLFTVIPAKAGIQFFSDTYPNALDPGLRRGDVIFAGGVP
jgi:hypothetical protein